MWDPHKLCPAVQILTPHKLIHHIIYIYIDVTNSRLICVHHNFFKLKNIIKLPVCTMTLCKKDFIRKFYRVRYLFKKCYAIDDEYNVENFNRHKMCLSLNKHQVWYFISKLELKSKLTSNQKSTASCITKTRVPTRVKFKLHEKVSKNMVARWWKNISQKSCNHTNNNQYTRDIYLNYM